MVLVRTQRKTQPKVQRRVKNTRDKVHEGAPYIRCSIHQVFRWVHLLVWGARSGSRPLFSLGFMAHQHITIHYRSQTYYRKIPDIHKDILPTTFITSPTPAELAHQCTCGHKISINPNPFCGASVSSEQVTNQSINQQEIRVLFILN